MGARIATSRIAFAATAIAAFWLFAIHDGSEPEARAGTQQCNTECQSKMTDCILACDGMRSCEEGCKKKGLSCVTACTSDAGPLPPPETPDADLDATAAPPIEDARSVTAKDASRRRGRDRDR
jgi:hypothetical protein